MYRKFCQYCGRPFVTKTNKAKYCCDKCRVYANREAKRSTASMAGDAIISEIKALPEERGTYEIGTPEKLVINDDSISEKVLEAHGLVAFFDVASQSGPEEKRDACRLLAIGIENVFREVGL